MNKNDNINERYEAYESIPKANRISEIAGVIAPMFEMLYDRLTRETIEGLEGEFEEEG